MIANYKIVQRMQSLSGFSRREAELALQTAVRAIRESILEGKEFGLYKFISIDFWRRKGRTIPLPPDSHMHGKSTQKDCWVLRFKPHSSLRKQLKKTQQQWKDGPTKL